tara:strand:- start:23 stop:370 length:348 start_codon:yes stop_codon:yes gene_type:complete
LPSVPAATYDAVAPAGTVIAVAATLLNELVITVGASTAREMIVDRALQLANAKAPIEVTPLGIVILLRLVQLANALFPIEVTLSGIVMLVRLEHPPNAVLPIEVTLSGMVMLVRP